MAWRLLNALVVFLNGKTYYKPGQLHLAVWYMHCNRGQPKAKGAVLCLPFPHIQMLSFSNLYKGPMEVNNRLSKLALGEIVTC